MTKRTTSPVFLLPWCLVVLSFGACAPPSAVYAPRPGATRSAGDVALAPEQISELRAYIAKTWDTLTRTIADLPRAAEDPKFPPPSGGAWPVYVAEGEFERVRAELDAALELRFQGRRSAAAARRLVAAPTR